MGQEVVPILPIELRLQYQRQVKKRICIASILFLCFFILGYSKTFNYFMIFMPICVFYIISLHKIKLTNIRCGVVMSNENGKCNCLFHDEHMKMNFVVESVVINEPVSIGDSIYLYDYISIFSKKRKRFVEYRNRIKRPNVTINSKISLQEIPDEIKQYCRCHLVSESKIQSIQVGKLYKTSHSRKRRSNTNGRTRGDYDFFIFTTQTQPISVECWPTECLFFEPGDMFYLVKFKNKKKYVPIPIITFGGNAHNV